MSTATTIAFQPGRTYWTRSIGDHDCIHRITVASRTAKFITTTAGKRLGISLYEGEETVKPNGSYSMCAVISAAKDEAAERIRLTDAVRMEEAAGNPQGAERARSRLAAFVGLSA